jgi:ArsR family transcriptional regulator, arsenate/arsenite/antimonite-responsive transcriptional repressor
MPIAKTEAFAATEVQLAVYAKALAHPARIAILRELAKRGTCICGEIVEVLPLAQSTVSQHLKALKEAGLIDGEVEGPRSCYCLNVKAVKLLSEALGGLVKTLSRPLSRPNCC